VYYVQQFFGDKRFWGQIVTKCCSINHCNGSDCHSHRPVFTPSFFFFGGGVDEQSVHFQVGMLMRSVSNSKQKSRWRRSRYSRARPALPEKAVLTDPIKM
jgi:hypothetical protein